MCATWAEVVQVAPWTGTDEAAVIHHSLYSLYPWQIFGIVPNTLNAPLSLVGFLM